MKTKRKTIGGREYTIFGSTTESERGRVVFQSFTVPGGKVILENGKVTHPDGTITDAFGKTILDDESKPGPFILETETSPATGSERMVYEKKLES